MNTKNKIQPNPLTPSPLGIVTYTSVSCLLILLHQLAEIKRLLQLPANFNLLPIVMTWLDNLLTGTLGQGTTETVVVGAFWAVVGLGVYILLHGTSRLILELGNGLDVRKYEWPRGSNRNRPLIKALERNVFCIVAGIGLVFMVFGPLARVLSGPVFVGFIGPSVPLQMIIWFPISWLVMHVCVVLARLVFLKPRLFD